MNFVRNHILVCGGTGCVAAKSKEIIEEFNLQLQKHGLENEAKVILTGCFGLCALGPIVVVYPEGSFYSEIKVENIAEIVEEHILKGRVVEKLLYQETVKEDSIASLNETGFYKKQMRISLRNCGVIDPENIDEYIAFDGYEALAKALTAMTPDEIVEEILKSGLRGRGGGGFPTGLKWKFAAKEQNDVKYVCCNADEGDPGAFMDRSVLEGDPHNIIESMAIAGYAIGASQGYIYVRAEYPIAVERMQHAIKQAKEYGFLGNNIFGTGFNFDLEVRLGAGAFVCGEETALMMSIEGQRGEPRPRPPFPAVKGLFGKPTVLNNVETFTNITWILLHGAEAFQAIGTEKSKGTKVFALGGNITNTGLVEVPMGITLREIVEEIGGGVPNGKAFKAAQTGGPSGGCIPTHMLDIKIDYDSLMAVGSMMGSGGLIVMDEDSCMVDIAKFFLDFTVEESCGKCTPCRIGTKRMLDILEKISEGHGTLEDIDALEELSAHIKENSLCGLGQTAPNPVASTLHHFRDEYLAHVNEHRCPAGVCKNLLQYFIQQDKCIGCTLCQRVCPTAAIAGEVKKPETFEVIQDKCIKCGACIDKCKPKAIIKK
ncbi:MAG: NADH-quinone oxidoreductase subunit NuoF [Oscillospiraceae bacterium]|nr:NADH-quinone oxidoreductase subunit NuoF [Oscillospiraceae bacterium]